MNILFLGPPGSGKGTQSKMLQDKYGLVHLSTGDMFREAIGKKTELGIKAKAFMDRGEYVPDSLTNALVRDRLSHDDALGGFLLDGYPRTIDQVHELDSILTDAGKRLDVVVQLTADTDELVRRLAHRAEVEGRADDTPEVIRRRLEVYDSQTAPLIDVYAARGLVAMIDGLGDIADVTARIIEALEARGLLADA
jgi:adenylate kinase